MSLLWLLYLTDLLVRFNRHPPTVRLRCFSLLYSVPTYRYPGLHVSRFGRVGNFALRLFQEARRVKGTFYGVVLGQYGPRGRKRRFFFQEVRPTKVPPFTVRVRRGYRKARGDIVTHTWGTLVVVLGASVLLGQGVVRPNVRQPRPTSPPRARERVAQALSGVRRIRRELCLPQVGGRPGLFPSITGEAGPPILLSTRCDSSRRPSGSMYLYHSQVGANRSVARVARLPLLRLIPYVQRVRISRPVPGDDEYLLFRFCDVRGILPCARHCPCAPRGHPSAPPTDWPRSPIPRKVPTATY